MDSSIDSDDRPCKIQPIMNHLNIVVKNYVLDKSLCIGESIMLLRGRLIFRQYIKNKKHKYDRMLYKMCELNGLIIKIKIYFEKEESGKLLWFVVENWM